MTYSVLVCDDEQEIAEHWVEKIQEVAPPEYKLLPVPTNDDVRDATREMLQRRGTVREKQQRKNEKCLFDDADILFIDYDLLHIDDNNAQHTGESIARLARTFSYCSVIVVLNQYRGTDFDLSLRGHLTSHADLNINDKLIATPSLWKGPPWEGFRPWSWQTLSQAVETQRARVNMVNKGFDCSIVETLGMEVIDVFRLSDTAFEFIAPKASNFNELETITFKSFLSMTPNGRDAEALLESEPEASARFVAARIGKLLEREILGPQDVLIDVPHLLQRFPFLLGKNVSDIGAWNDTIHHMKPLNNVLDENYWFKPSDCLSKPAVWYQRLETNEEISTQRAAFDFSNVPDVVFLEDCSVFAERSEATDFRAGFHNLHDRRYMKNIEGINYGPQRRLAFGG